MVTGENGDHFLSFESICETLELHPDYIREGLMSWKEKRLKSIRCRPVVRAERTQRNSVSPPCPSDFPKLHNFSCPMASGLSVYANILADATAMEAEAMFHSFWNSKKCLGCSAVFRECSDGTKKL